MIRKAILKDVNSIEDTYNEHFQYELNHTAFTVFKPANKKSRLNWKNIENFIQVENWVSK